MRNIIGAVALSFFLVAGCVAGQAGQAGRPHFTQHFEGSLFTVTEKELFSVEIAAARKGLDIGSEVLGIIIHNAKDEDVEDANLQVTVHPPGEGGSPDPLPVSQRGGGLYVMKKIDLRRKGEWELRVKVVTDNLQDAAVFHFPGPK